MSFQVRKGTLALSGRPDNKTGSFHATGFLATLWRLACWRSKHLEIARGDAVAPGSSGPESLRRDGSFPVHTVTACMADSKYPGENEEIAVLGQLKVFERQRSDADNWRASLLAIMLRSSLLPGSSRLACPASIWQFMQAAMPHHWRRHPRHACHDHGSGPLVFRSTPVSLESRRLLCDLISSRRRAFGWGGIDLPDLSVRVLDSH